MLLGLAALFAAPLAIAFLMYYGHSALQPRKRVNHGELVNPVVSMPPLILPLASAGTTPADLLRHKWTLVFVGDGACDERCRKALYDTRQVRIALDRDMVRVQRVFLATGVCCDLAFLQLQHPDLVVARAGDPAAPWLQRLQAAPPSGRIYLVDPLSNLMMTYAPATPAKGMLEDLKRLLKLSQIG